jgi:hypothetical protein
VKDYHDFIERKTLIDAPSGFEPGDINPALFEWQADIVRYACMRGRFGGYEDCGLGKSIQQLESARLINEHTGLPVMIFAPLAVAEQTKREARKFDIQAEVRVCKDQSHVGNCINVANYERLHLFEPEKFGGVLLDEGSILKSIDGKIRGQLLNDWQCVPYRQSWSATPAPNDFMEIGNQAEFLGVMKRSEMLATFFVHDGGDTSKWRLKGHAREAFWRWMASWCVMVRRPSDLGYADEGYDLPPIQYHEHYVDSKAGAGQLFATNAGTLQERRNARRSSLFDRCKAAASIVEQTCEPCVLWCNLNDEGETLAKMIPGAVEVAGRHTLEQKEERLAAFTRGDIQTLITKPKIGGFGLNWQHCPKTVIFPTDSWEQWYQMVRRFWRFGQTQQVNVHAVASEAETGVIENLRRKEQDAGVMFDGIAAAMSELSREQIRKTERQTTTYTPEQRMEFPQWLTA